MRWKNQDIPDNHILSYIENNERFRIKVARLIGAIYKQRENLTPEQRRERAKTAANARWKTTPDDTGNR